MSESLVMLYATLITVCGGTGFLMGRMPMSQYVTIKWVAVVFALLLTVLSTYASIMRAELQWLLPIVAPWALAVILGTLTIKRARAKCTCSSCPLN